MAGVKLKEYYAEEAKERQGTRNDIVATLPPSDKGKSRDKTVKVVGVGGKSIDKAVLVSENAPDLEK